ncbi:MAG: HI0074 family nucleotidyltransferase substrate-binding subunit [Candidatus Caenarcaniphilales bacterium]|nr:HI0074 family nucleotidyltransferase substrate-binding subunit [Candidatus Caenarcaniphilales bacterium]
MNDYLKEKLVTFEQALETLSEAFVQNPSQLEIDGAIQRFEYCFELSWKTLKLVLNRRGITEKINSPKSCFQRSFLDGLIENEEAWLKMLQGRNLSTHTYNKQIADEIYISLPQYYELMKVLLRKLKAENRI